MPVGQKRHTVSVRLDAEEERHLRRVARRQRTSVSEVVREAIGLMVREQRQTIRPFDEISDLVGVVHDLPSDLSEKTGQRFAEIVSDAKRRK